VVPVLQLAFWFAVNKEPLQLGMQNFHVMINNKKFAMKHVLHITNNDDGVKLPRYKSDVLVISNDEYYTKKLTL
jgi:hypothetical protein